MESILWLFFFSSIMFITLAALVLGFVMINKFLSRLSRLKELSACYAAPLQTERFNRTFNWRTLKLGDVQWKRCVDIALQPRGLYLAIHKTFAQVTPLLIPWQDLHFEKEARLYYRPAVALTIGSPAITTLTVFSEVYEQMRLYLED